MAGKKKAGQTQDLIDSQIRSLINNSPYILRITERKGYNNPVLEICERINIENEKTGKKTSRLKELGLIHGNNLRACQAAICYMVNHMVDNDGRPFDVHSLLRGNISYRGNIPLDTDAGAKIALLLRLQGQVRDSARAELMAWRIERFTQEEAMYWMSRTLVPTYGARSLEWNKSGLRIMLAGQQRDEDAVDDLLAKLRK